jgi:acetolactate synthase-1/2/3 large subunit
MGGKEKKESPVDESKRTFLKGITVAGTAALAAAQGLHATAGRAVAGESALESPPSIELTLRSSPITVKVETLGESFVECMTQAGVKYWFVNPGTDWPAFIESIAKRHQQGQEWPKIITVPHEFPATSAAHGYQMVTGESPLVGYHVTVGTYNAIGAIQNAYYSRTPLVLLSGRRSVTKEGMKGSDQGPIGQEPRDQAGPLRPYVKWDFEVRYAEHIPAIVQRALQIANTDPKGPVYISVPTETGMMPTDSVTIKPKELFTPSSPAMGDPEHIKLAAKLLVDASYPLIITEDVGVDLNAVAKLARLAETLAIPVRGAIGRYVNLPSTHPMNVNGSLKEADVIFTIASPQPWLGKSPGVIPNPNARYINLDADAARVEGYPIAGYYPADILMTGDPASTLDHMARYAQSYLEGSAAARERVRARFASIKAQHDRERAGAYASAMSKAAADPIDRSWVQYNIGQLIQPDDIAISDNGRLYPYCERAIPGTYFTGPPSSCLGWGLGAALGAKLARPQSTVVTVQGDGSFIYGCPTAVFFAARRHNLPFLAVVFNNQGWRSVVTATKNDYPKGWASKTNFSEMTDLSPTPDFGKIAESVGGYGQTVEKSRDVRPALEKALQAVRNGRVACLNFILAHYTG